MGMTVTEGLMSKRRDNQKLAARLVARSGDSVLEWLEDVLQTDDPSATMNRVFKSQHLKDLRLIVKFALLVPVVALIPCLIYAAETTDGVVHWSWSSILSGLTIKLVVLFLAHTVIYLGSVVTVTTAICAWAYRAGSTRLGVVDLFACEIDTLCRVTTVIDTVHRRVQMVLGSAGSTAIPADPGHFASSRFSSQENYFPVFESNNRDLQSLEADVVINVTAFYTYMKTVRDIMRKVAAVSPPAGGPPAGATAHLSRSWQESSVDLIYMLYLGLESGRKAIKDLVEFEPEQTERTIVILISELEGYAFLLQAFPAGDIHKRRLMLRWPAYERLVKEVRCLVDQGTKGRGSIKPDTIAHVRQQEVWRAADESLPTLLERYGKARALAAPEPIEPTNLAA
jgi:hypothetical protein